MTETTDLNRADDTGSVSLPRSARCPINRCNLPAVILGSLTFQQYPADLCIDGVRELHSQLFHALDAFEDPDERALHFRQYMASAFLLERSDEAGFDPTSSGVQRERADYRRLLRGWMFNADGVEAAVLKHWVESRFGLLARRHRGRLDDPEGGAYAAYQEDYLRGIYNTNALAAQVDMLFSYCQYEVRRRWPGRSHFLLYRGVNRIEQHEVLHCGEGNTRDMLLNNLNSFSGERETSDSFGDSIFETAVPYSKLLYFPGLLPGVLAGEAEYLVIGGVYRTRLA